MKSKAETVDELLMFARLAKAGLAKRAQPETKDIATAVRSFDSWSVAVWVAGWEERGSWTIKKARKQALAGVKCAAAIGFEEGLRMLLSIPEVASAALDTGDFWFLASDDEARRLRQKAEAPLWLPKSESGSVSESKWGKQKPAFADSRRSGAGAIKYTALGFACVNGHESSARVLIENERLYADPKLDKEQLRLSAIAMLHGDGEARTRTEFHASVIYALLKKEYPLATMLIMGGAGSDGLISEMERAAEQGDLVAATIIMQGSVNFGFGYQKTTREELLAHAIKQERIDVAQKVCRLGADPSEPFGGERPLEAALERGYLDGIFFLAPNTHFGDEVDFRRAKAMARKFRGKQENGSDLGEWIENAMGQANPQWSMREKDEAEIGTAQASGGVEAGEQRGARESAGGADAAGIEGFKTVMLSMSEELAALRRQVEIMTQAWVAEASKPTEWEPTLGMAAKAREARETLAKVGFEQVGRINARRAHRNP